jgi:hypothetical protein
MVKRITKELTRSRKSKKDRQCNGQKDNKELQNITQKTKDRATRTGDELRFS